MGRGGDRHPGGAQQRPVFLGHHHQRPDPQSTPDEVDRHPLGGQHQGPTDRTPVPGGKATLFVQMRQPSWIWVAVGLPGLGDYQLTILVGPDHPHHPRRQQLTQTLGGHPIHVTAAGRDQIHSGEQLDGGRLVASFDPSAAAGPAAQAGQHPGRKQQGNSEDLPPRVDQRGSMDAQSGSTNR